LIWHFIFQFKICTLQFEMNLLRGGSFPLASTGVLLRSTGALSTAIAADAVLPHGGRHAPLTVFRYPL
jgi:hypothetical protein